MRFYLLLFTVPLMVFSEAEAQTYKWIDENGVVSYSQTPPPEQNSLPINVGSQPRRDSEQANSQLKALQQKLEDLREDRQLAKEQEAKTVQKEQIKQKNCAAARANLRKLEGLGHRLLKTSDGNYVRLTEEERQQRIQKATEQIKTNCSTE